MTKEEKIIARKNRKNAQLRKVRLQTGVAKYAEGSCLVQFGNTKVWCTATVEDNVPPFKRDSGEGWVTAEYSMLPRSTNERMRREVSKGKVGGRTAEIQRLIGRSLRAVVDFQKLGEKTLTIDCDVLQADGGTRTAAITGGFVAMAEAVKKGLRSRLLEENPLQDYVAAVSVGIVDSVARLDLEYVEDVGAEVDMNIVMTGRGKYVEIQGTAEEHPFTETDFERMKKLAASGIRDLVKAQKQALKGFNL